MGTLMAEDMTPALGSMAADAYSLGELERAAFIAGFVEGFATARDLRGGTNGTQERHESSKPLCEM